MQRPASRPRAMKETKEQESSQAALIIQNSFIKNKLKVPFQRMAQQFSFNIPECSRRNMQALYRELREKTLLPSDAERKHYPSGNGAIYTAQEWALRELWFAKLVPKMTFKHAATRVNFTELSPIGARERKGKKAHVNHTGTNALNEFSFGVLNIGDEHLTPAFLGCNVETVIARVGQVTGADARYFSGLWFGNEFSAEREGTVLYGDCKRKVEFDRITRHKTYTYERANGTIIHRRVQEKDEIYAADKNLNTLWDALFNLFILELRLIGGSLQQYAYQHANDERTITHLYRSLFKSWVYPEAKLPLTLPLDKPFITIQRYNPDVFANASRWFIAARTGDTAQLERLIHSDWPLDLTNEHHETALLLAAENGHTAAAKLLLAHGADFGIRNVLCRQACHIALEANNKDLIEVFLQGVVDSKLPSIIRFPQYDIEALRTACIINNNSGLFWRLLAAGAQITSEYAVISWLYTASQTVELARLLNHGVNIDAVDYSGFTALMHAAQKGDVTFVQELLSFSANVDVAVPSNKNFGNDHKGETALFAAARAGHIPVLELLLKQGANPQHQNAQGQTVAQMISDILTGGYENYVKPQMSSISARYHGALSVSTEAAEFQMKLMRTRLRSECQTLEKSCTQVKQFLEERGLTAINAQPNHLIKYTHHITAGVAIITGRIANQPHVLMVRHKAADSMQPIGFYQFPGGLAEEEDQDTARTAFREAKEETGFSAPEAIPSQLVHTFQYVNLDEPDGVPLVVTDFHHLDVGDQLSRFPIHAKSEVASAEYINLEKIQYNPERNAYFYNGVRIKQSNILMVNALLAQQTLPWRAINQCLLFQYIDSTPLATALQDGNSKIVSDYDCQGYDFNSRHLLASFCAKGDSRAVQLLLNVGAEVNRVYPKAPLPTALMMALGTKQDALAKHLIEHCGADVAVFFNGQSALSVACLFNHDMVPYLLERCPIDLPATISGPALMALMLWNETDAEKQNALNLAAILLQRFKLDLNCRYPFPASVMSFQATTYPLWTAVNSATDNKIAIGFVKLLLDHDAHPFVTHNTLSIMSMIEHKLMLYRADQYMADCAKKIQEKRKARKEANSKKEMTEEEINREKHMDEIDELDGSLYNPRGLFGIPSSNKNTTNPEVLQQITEWINSAMKRYPASILVQSTQPLAAVDIDDHNTSSEDENEDSSNRFSEPKLG